MLGELAKEPPVPSTIDVARAVQDGRRRRRTRRMLECGAVVTAVGLILGSVGLLGARTPGPVTVAAPGRFDPMTRYADFGWLPSRLSERSVWIQPERLILEASVPGVEPTVRPASRVAVVLYPAGKQPGANLVEDLPWPMEGGCRSDDGTIAPRVGGRPARWVYPRVAGGARCDPTTVELRWQYKPGAWAVARTERLTPGDGDPRSVLRRVAQALRVGVNEPLRVPFRAGFVPPGLQPAVSIERGDPGSMRWSVTIGLDARASSADGNGPKPRQSVITAIPAASHSPTGESEPLNTTVDGHRAYRRTLKNRAETTEILRVAGVHGFEFRIETSDVGHSAPERILRGLTILGTDRTTWTSRPFD
jgi:rRNA maturation protein Nop10